MPDFIKARLSNAKPPVYFVDPEDVANAVPLVDRIDTVAGPPGPQGPAGPQGPQGLPGDQGVMGPIGATGPAGPAGIQGIQGIKGDKGDRGDIGPAGPQGIQGVKGDRGDQGIQGPAGATGATGPVGPASTVPGPTAYGSTRTGWPRRSSINRCRSSRASRFDWTVWAIGIPDRCQRWLRWHRSSMDRQSKRCDRKHGFYRSARPYWFDGIDWTSRTSGFDWTRRPTRKYLGRYLNGFGNGSDDVELEHQYDVRSEYDR